MDDWDAYPEAEAEARGTTGCTVLLMLLVLLVLMGALMPSELRHGLPVLLRHIRAGDLPPKAAAALPSLYCFLFAMVAYVAPGLALMLYRTWVGLRWRGSDVRADAAGITVGREEKARHWTWDQVAIVPRAVAEFAFTTRAGERVAIPLVAFDRLRLGPAGRWRAASAGRRRGGTEPYLAAVARAYLSAARRGSVAPLDEPPRLCLAYPRPGARRPWLLWLILGPWLIAWVSMSIGLALMPGPMSVLEQVVCQAILQVAVVGGIVLLWRLGRRTQRSGVLVGERGLTVWMPKGRQCYAWQDITEMRHRFGMPADLAIRVSGKRVALPALPPLLWANLSALARAERAPRGDILLACYRYYTASTVNSPSPGLRRPPTSHMP
jgi:hypothetical protein